MACTESQLLRSSNHLRSLTEFRQTRLALSEDTRKEARNTRSQSVPHFLQFCHTTPRTSFIREH